MALALCREDAVSGWRDMLGPKNPEEAKETAPDRWGSEVDDITILNICKILKALFKQSPVDFVHSALFVHFLKAQVLITPM